MTNWMRGLLTGLAGAASLLVMTGCEVDSASGVERTVGVDFTGFYSNPNGGNVTSRNSGRGVSSLDLRQGGDRLEAVDNNGGIWKGSIGDFNGTTASFEMTGQTTAGKEGRFSGTLTVNGGSTSTNGSSGSAQGIMRGTYIESDFYATFYAESQSIPGTTPSGGSGTNGTGGVNISVSGSSTLTSNGQTTSLSVSGGSGSYTWSVSGSSGSLSATSGSSVTYARTSSGNNTVSVTDSSGNSDSVAITQP